MRYFVSILCIFICSCSSISTSISEKPQYVGVDETVQLDEIAQISSACNAECYELVQKSLNVEFSFLGRISLMSAVLKSVNGSIGSITHRCMDCSSVDVGMYNNPSTYDYNVLLPPGITDLELSVQFVAARYPQNTNVSFVAMKSHAYFVGQILDTSMNGLATGPIKYRWQPIVVDTTSNKLVYPTNGINWRDI